jgi:hypothetical protein
MARTKKKRARKLGENDLAVVGLGADGYGVLAGFKSGEGSMVREEAVAAARRAGIPLEWMPPAKEARVQLSRAVAAVASAQRLNPEHETKRDRQVIELREPVSRWYLVRGGALSPKAGEPYGKTALVATLYDLDVTGAQRQTIEYDPPDSPLAAEVQARFDELTGVEQLQATDIAKWLNEVFEHHMMGVMHGGGWHIPVEHRVLAESMTEVFWNELRWGRGWFDPPMPACTCKQLSAGLANGLIALVASQIKLLETRRNVFRRKYGGYSSAGREVPNGKHDKSGKLVDIGAVAAEGFMIRLARVRAKVDSYTDTLGSEKLAVCHRVIDDAMIELDAALVGGVTNANGSFRDIEAEERREETETSFA